MCDCYHDVPRGSFLGVFRQPPYGRASAGNCFSLPAHTGTLSGREYEVAQNCHGLHRVVQMGKEYRESRLV